MTNKEWMSTLDAEQFYDKMMWLVRDYGFRFNNTRLAVIAWLDEPHEAEPTQNKTSNTLNNDAMRWIPVTERLPEICERDVNGNITFSEMVWSCIDCGDGFYWQQTDQYTTNCGGGWMSEVPEDGFTPKVVAWMPLPEPYEVK